MYTKLIKFVLLLSLVLLSGFAGRVLHSPLLNRASRGRDPRHIPIVRTERTIASYNPSNIFASRAIGLNASRDRIYPS